MKGHYKFVHFTRYVTYAKPHEAYKAIEIFNNFDVGKPKKLSVQVKISKAEKDERDRKKEVMTPVNTHVKLKLRSSISYPDVGLA